MSKQRYPDWDDGMRKLGIAIIIILMVAAGLAVSGILYLLYVFATQGVSL